MTGVPGRSGKATSPEAKAAKAAGGRKAGRGRPLGVSRLPPVLLDLDPTADDPVARLGRPVTWGDELKRQQVEGERIQNRRRQVEVERAAVELAKAQDERDLARGKLLPLDKHREAVAAIVTAIIESITPVITAAVDLHPPEQQPRARHAMDVAVAKWREEAMGRIKSA